MNKLVETVMCCFKTEKIICLKCILLEVIQKFLLIEKNTKAIKYCGNKVETG